MLNEITEVQIDPRVVKDLKVRIINKEIMNLSTKNLTDAKMVQWIKKQIEEEVKKCSSNQ